MKFDIFCEIQRALPWVPGDDEASLIRDTLEEARTADVAGFDTWWQVEHHGSPPFSYSAAPELILTAIALATKQLRVGHAGVLAPFRINHPLRVAERAAVLDILSGGRFELGLAKSGGKEWETFGVDPQSARDEVREALQMIPRMWTETEFSWNSDLINIPPREVTPRPLQKPHPRLWQTCGSPESFYMAGELGVGALGTTLLSPVSVLGRMMREHDRGLADCQSPVGHTVNAQKGAFTFVHVADSRAAAIENGAAWSALWYVNAAATTFKVPLRVWYDMIKAGLHPNSAGVRDLDSQDTIVEPDDPPVLVLLKRMAQGQSVGFKEAHETLEALDCAIIGDPAHCVAKARGYAAIGVDRLMCMMQFGSLSHPATLRSIELAGLELIPALAGAAHES